MRLCTAPVARLYRSFRSKLHRQVRHVRARRVGPVLTQEQILHALQRLEPAAVHTVMVHSSLSACGYIKGGPQAVIEALRDWCGGATLAMPTHSYCYPDAKENCVLFDVERTPSRVGAITETFWRQPGIERSLHPTHSLACEGSAAGALIAGHEKCDTPCGRGTPYERLVAWDAGVLMFGTTLNTYTLFHTAEDAAEVPYLYERRPYQLRIRGRNGEARDFPMRRQDMTIARRFAETASWLEERCLLYRQPCGRGELLWLPSAAAVHRTVTSALREDPWFLVAPGSCPPSPGSH